MTTDTKVKTTQDLDWDLQCYGMSEGALRDVVSNCESNIALGDITMLVASFMSNAQEEIDRGMSDRARQSINCAKFILFKYVYKEAE